MTYAELIEKRNKLIADARGIYDAAASSDAGLTNDVLGKFDELMQRADECLDQANAAKRLEAAERARDEAAGQPERRGGHIAAPSRSGTEDRGGNIKLEYRGQEVTIHAGTEAHRRASDEYREAWNEFVLRGDRHAFQRRGLQADIDSEGGYTLPPQQSLALIKAVDDVVWLRALGTVIPCGVEGIGVPSLETRSDDPDWTGEITEVTEDTAMKFGRRELKPLDLTKEITVSRKLLMNRAMNIESVVFADLAYKHGIAQENAFLNGTGAGQPLGLFTASDAGVPTSRDVSTGNTATAPTLEGLRNAIYAVKAQYRRNSGWLFHREVLKVIAALKDGNGRFLWEPDNRMEQIGAIGTLLGYPVYESEYAPSVLTTGLYVGLFGDFSRYYIADSLAPAIQRLDELYARKNKIGYIGRSMVDGMPASVGGEAFARVTLA